MLRPRITPFKAWLVHPSSKRRMALAIRLAENARMKWPALLLLATIGSAGSAPAAPSLSEAETPPPEGTIHVHEGVLETDGTLSLAELVREAAARAPGQWLVEGRAEEVEALDRAAGRWLSDRATLTGGFITDAVGNDDGYQQWEALLELPLWWPGQRSSRRELARATRTAAEASASAHLLETAGRVRSAVATLALSRNRLELARAEWQSETELAAQLERAVELGESSERDLLLAQSGRLDRELEATEALEEARHAEQSYRLLTGRSASPALWQEEPSPRKDLATHPLLVQARADVAAAEAGLRRLEREQWGAPSVELGAQSEKERDGASTSDRLVALVRIPLGRGSTSDFDHAAARRRLAEARRDAGRVERQLLDRLGQAEHQLELARRRVETGAEQASVARRHLELTDRGYVLGEIDLAELLDARARSIQAERAEQEAEILHRFHVAQWNQSLGVIP
jgi:outer membrane protein TolC